MGSRNRWNRRHRQFCTTCGIPDYKLWPVGLGPAAAWDSQRMHIYKNRPYCPKCFREVGGVFEKRIPHAPEELAQFALEALGEDPKGQFVQFLKRQRNR